MDPVSDGSPSAGVKGVVLVALTLSIVSRMSGNSEIDAPSDLRGEFFELFGPERACSPLLARRHLAGSQRDGTAREAQPSHSQF